MRLIASGTAANQDIANTYVTVATLPRPACDSARYLLEIRLLGVGTGNEMSIRRTIGANVYFDPLLPDTGQDTVVLEVNGSVYTTAEDIIIAVADQAVGSGASDVSWAWLLYRTDEPQLPQPDYLVPLNSTTVPLLFRMGQAAGATTPVVSLSKNGAAFATAAGVVSSIGNAWYMLTPTAADTSTEGPLILKAVQTGAAGANSVVTVYSTFQVFSDTAAAEFANAAAELLAEDFDEMAALIESVGVPSGLAVEWEIRVEDSDGDPVDGADVWITEDEEGEGAAIDRATSNALGKAIVLLDPGTYYAWAQKGGKMHVEAYEFTVPGA
jgi:hypothetical protein